MTGSQGSAGHRWEIILAGEGGQGVVLAGALLGEAAVRAGLNAAHTSAYGIATRGGFTRSDIIVVPGEEEIAYPRVRRPDVLVALTPAAGQRLLPLCQPGTLFLGDRAGDGGQVHMGSPPARVLAIPLREAARQVGGERVVNMVALGALLAATGMFAPQVLEEVLRGRFPGERGETNCRAMWAGYGLLADQGSGRGEGT